MAYTVTIVDKTVFGNKRVNVLSVLADATTQNIVTGLQSVTYYALSPISMVTSTIRLAANSGAVGTSIAGVIGASGVTSGDQFYLICFGR